MFDLNEFAKEIHQNAVAHGWWEGERSVDEIIALIHSEWSEALEEYRACRPLVWHKCPYNSGMCETQEVHQCDFDCRSCTPDKRKPEGIAVELIDGCIRILDYFGKTGYELGTMLLAFLDVKRIMTDESFPSVIAMLHKYTAFGDEVDGNRFLVDAIMYALKYVTEQGIDAIALMKEKHEYNKTRPYKHGGKVR